jgi:hypothetical protein
MLEIFKNMLGMRFPMKVHKASPPLRQTRNDPGQPHTFGSGVEPLLKHPVAPQSVPAEAKVKPHISKHRS